MINRFLIALTFLLVSFLVGTSKSFATPAPEEFVINESTNQCGIYFAGDEYRHSDLPSGWKIYDPRKNNGIVETPYGTCKYQYGNPEACCQQLGLEFVDRNLTSEDQNKSANLDSNPELASTKLLYAFVITIALLSVAVVAIVRRVYRK